MTYSYIILLLFQVQIHSTIIFISQNLVVVRRTVAKCEQYIGLHGTVRFFHPRSSYTTTHISADVQRTTLNASTVWRRKPSRVATCKETFHNHIGYVQWRRNRGFRRFNEPGPPSSWAPE